MSMSAARRTGSEHPVPAVKSAITPPATLKIVNLPPIEAIMHPHVYLIALGFMAQTTITIFGKVM